MQEQRTAKWKKIERCQYKALCAGVPADPRPRTRYQDLPSSAKAYSGAVDTLIQRQAEEVDPDSTLYRLKRSHRVALRWKLKLEKRKVPHWLHEDKDHRDEQE